MALRPTTTTSTTRWRIISRDGRENRPRQRCCTPQCQCLSSSRGRAARSLSHLHKRIHIRAPTYTYTYREPNSPVHYVLRGFDCACARSARTSLIRYSLFVAKVLVLPPAAGTVSFPHTYTELSLLEFLINFSSLSFGL